MAELIPAYFDDQTPPGEQDVFRMISSGPENWVVLHALDLAPWNRSRRTEIDFLIIVPSLGILCVEVKSHSEIGFDGKKWSPNSIKRSPFKQAEDGSKTFYRHLKALRPNLPRIPIVHCCIFPRAFFKIGNIASIHEWELIDKSTFSRFRSSNQFCDSLARIMTKCIEADPDISPLTSPLSQPQVRTIVEACVPVQKRTVDDRRNIDYRSEQVERLLIKQQKPILKLARLNKRVLVGGPAGTGKTLIAMEVARRAVEDGKRVALLCFNRFIADWVRTNLYPDKELPPNLVVGTVHGALSEMAEIPLPEFNSGEFWESDWPDQLEDRITDPDWWGTACFDYLVIDEAQDVLSRPRLWDCLQLLIDPTDSPSFCLFGDFENQVISNRESLRESLTRIKDVYDPVYWDLDENCRNYGITGEVALSLSELPPNTYADFLRGPGVTDSYDLDTYSSSEEQVEKLVIYIRYFLHKGFKPNEISVLSMRNEESCTAALVDEGDFKLDPFRRASRKSVTYCSIHAFKGMENRVIILTDLSLKENEYDRNLFYIGMTRATEHLRLLLDKELRSLIMQRAIRE